MASLESLRTKLSAQDFDKLSAIDNPQLHDFISKYATLCEPNRIFVCSDTRAELDFMQEAALKSGEETALATPGHTYHFDGYYDQARDKDHTLFLVPKGMDLGPHILAMDKEQGTQEVHDIMRCIMQGHTMYVRFFCLGPVNSEFSVPSVQLTDSAYVSHSLDLLYRQGYEEFKRLGKQARFFRVVHSQGETDDHQVSKNVDQRRVYIDTTEDIVYSLNTQYGGNSLGLKKLSMRLAINRASKEDWLCEHMFLMGVHGPHDRVTYLTGAFPSMCGKTSTAMMNGETIVGDDIVYLRHIEDEIRAVNVERGMFGIIQGVNAKDDPMIWRMLREPGEVIFSNILVTEDRGVYWLEKGTEMPARGINHSGDWQQGKKDAKGKTIDASHKNARFTLALERLTNIDPKLHDPAGCKVGGLIYGGRDSEAWVPVTQAFNWVHGIITCAASLESETTAAAMQGARKEGDREFNPMSNLDFLSIPIGRYISDNLRFGGAVAKPPLIFGVNYFLRCTCPKCNHWLNDKTDKGIWLKWMELRCHDEIEAITTPVGYIPTYEDLKRLFKDVQNKDFTRQAYLAQFSLRVARYLEKIDRILAIYKRDIPDAPLVFFEVMNQQRERLVKAQCQFGGIIEPEQFRYNYFLSQLPCSLNPLRIEAN